MTGLVKAKKYDWKDSNLALFGSDTEREVKKESAMTEPAWEGAGQSEGLQIWRIVKFEVTHWPKEDYGKFYSGDSYIILNTYKQNPDSEALSYDVHFWIGSKSTQDEYGTAAYKTVELDTLLDDKAVQYREVQGHESELFKSYFKKGVTIMEGGADSGFRHVEPETYRPRLLLFTKQDRVVVVKEVPRNRARMNSGDVFILDNGLKLYQWNGSSSSGIEKAKAMQFLQELEGDRGTAQSEVLDEFGMSDEHPFYALLDEEDEDDEDIPDGDGAEKELYKISDAAGDMSMTKVKEGEVGMDDFSSADVFLFDTGKTCFVWVGQGASTAEKRNGFGYAQNHLKGTAHPLASIVVITEGQYCEAFTIALAA